MERRVVYLSLSALRVDPALLAHESRPSLEVVLDGGVLDRLQAHLRGNKMFRYPSRVLIQTRYTYIKLTFLISTLPEEATGLIAWREGLQKIRIKWKILVRWIETNL